MNSPLIITGTWFNLVLKYIMSQICSNHYPGDIINIILQYVYDCLFPVISCGLRNTLLKIDNRLYACGSADHYDEIEILGYKIKTVKEIGSKFNPIEYHNLIYNENLSFYINDIKGDHIAGQQVSNYMDSWKNISIDTKLPHPRDFFCFGFNHMKDMDRNIHYFRWFSLSNQFQFLEMKSIIVLPCGDTYLIIILTISNEIYVKSHPTDIIAQKLELPPVKCLTGSNSNCIITTIFGDIYVCGNNSSGELGVGHEYPIFPLPVKINLNDI